MEQGAVKPEDLDEFKSRINHVKANYENLINLSNCYSKSFLNLDNLSKLIEDFSIDLNKIENQLASQSYIEIGNLNQMSNEIDIISVCIYIFILFSILCIHLS